MKTVSEEIIRKRVLRTGDGSHIESLKTPQQQLTAILNDPTLKNNDPLVWGWDDVDMSSEEKSIATIIKRKAE